MDNINRRSQILDSAADARSETGSIRSVSTVRSSDVASSSGVFSPMSPDKAEEGVWKKKKGPAPPRPIPPKRAVKKLPRKSINQELFDIEVKQGELERQGVILETKIR